MKISKRTIMALVSILLTSILLGSFVDLLNTDSIVTKTQTKDKLTINDSSEHLMWFLQISDTHLSVFKDPFRITDFKDFCCRTIDTIKPTVVVASGDLTDARTANGLKTQQIEKEWQYYLNILDECQVGEKTVWLDIRGNHDTFNVAGSESKQNYFSNYSIQGRRYPRSYLHQITQGASTYSFMAIDASLGLGAGMPFNFIGKLDQKEIDDVNRLIAKTISSGSNYTVWFGHFPTSCIVSTGDLSVRNLIKSDPKALVYLCGHLHTAAGLVPKMYTLQKSGFLELELGDWKNKRIYRLMALDHGMLSFVDVPHGEWPIGLITNPKHALFVNSEKENLDNIKTSTHIRVLAFSLSEITTVKVRIDGAKWMTLYHVDGPRYVLEWNPNKYLSGLHTIDLSVKDAHGRENYYSQPFVMDDTHLSFSLLSRFFLMTDVSTIFRVMFLVIVIICMLPLIISRLLHKRVEANKLCLLMRGSCWKRWMQKFWLLSTVDRIFWPIVLYPVYLLFGPWSIGHVVEDNLGAIFAWGIVVNGSYVPESVTCVYGGIQLLIFQVPLTFILAHGVDHSFRRNMQNSQQRKTLCRRIALHLPFFLLFVIHILLACLFWMAYGTLTFVLGPLRTWSILLAAFLWYNAVYLPEKCTRKAARLLQIVPSSDESDGRQQ